MPVHTPTWPERAIGAKLIWDQQSFAQAVAPIFAAGHNQNSWMRRLAHIDHARLPTRSRMKLFCHCTVAAHTLITLLQYRAHIKA